MSIHGGLTSTEFESPVVDKECPTPEPLGERLAIILFVTLLFFLTFISRVIFAPLLPVIKQELGIKTDLFLMNPIHSLFVPAKVERPLENIRSSLGLAGANSVLTMQRFSRPIEDGFDTTMLVADSLVEEERVILGLDEMGKLSYNSSIFSVENIETFQEFENQHFETHVSEAFAEIEKTAENIIIESFNDSAWPWENLVEVDHVLVVIPGHVFSYDPERFRKGTFLYHRGRLPIREVSFSRMSDLLKPTNGVTLRPDTPLVCDELTAIGFECHTRKND